MPSTSVDPVDVEAAVQQLKTLAGTIQTGHRARLSVGVINNMPDKALDATARQFGDLLRGTAQHFDMRIQMFTLPTIPRAGIARERIETDYFDFDRLQKMHMDALIVTGAPPGTGALTSEPFWPQFAELVEWARTHTISTLWSCLSAHAAVLHLDGIKRERMPRKLSGVFDVTTQPQHPLLAGLAPQIPVAHSRYNAIDEAELRSAGYDVLTRSDTIGPDIFTKVTPSLFVFFQGHPEYDADTLAREYRRDLGRFLDGSSRECPDLPVNYFPADVEQRLRSSAMDYRLDGAPSIVPDMTAEVAETSRWSANSQQFFRNWIAQVIALKAQNTGAIRKVVDVKAHAQFAELVRDQTTSPPLEDVLASDEVFPMDIVTHLFRRAMRELTSGVSIITAGSGDQRTGLTATSVTSLAMTPASLLVCVQRSSSSIPALRKGRGFAVNLLAAEHQPIADHFAGRSGVRGAERFATGDWQTGTLDVPVLSTALAAVECRIARIVEWHTHSVIFGEVASVRFRDTGDALIYRRGAYEIAGPSIVPDEQ